MPQIKLSYNTKSFHTHLSSLKLVVTTKIAVKAVKQGLRPLQAAVKYRVPVDSGTMKSSIISNARTSSKNSKRVVGLVGSSSAATALRRAIKAGKSADYTPSKILHIVEHGRKKWRPFKGRKFMEKAIKDAYITAEAEVVRAFDEAIAAINQGASPS